MPSILHIINKQVFNFECVQSEHAFQIENKFDYNVQSRISKILEKACDNISAGDTDIRIALLEIDLGKFISTGWMRRWYRLLKKASMENYLGGEKRPAVARGFWVTTGRPLKYCAIFY